METKSVVFQIRVTPNELATYMAAANAAGRTASDWARSNLWLTATKAVRESAEELVFGRLGNDWAIGDDLRVANYTRKAIRWALSRLHKSGAIERTGRGVKGDPYRYRRMPSDGRDIDY